MWDSTRREWSTVRLKARGTMTTSVGSGCNPSYIPSGALWMRLTRRIEFLATCSVFRGPECPWGSRFFTTISDT